MERILLTRGKQRMSPTVNAFKKRGDYWLGRGWKVASESVLLETMEEQVEPKEKPSKKRAKTKKEEVIKEEE